MLQDIMGKVFVPHNAGDQEKERGTVPLKQDFERALVADLRLLDQIIIR